MKQTTKRPALRSLAVLLAVLFVLSVFSSTALAFSESQVTERNLVVNSSFEDSFSPSETLSGWELSGGFSVVSGDADEGKNALVYSSSELGTARSQSFAVEGGTDYVLMARMKKSSASDIAKVSVDGLDVELSCDEAGAWSLYKTEFNSGSATELSVTATAQGSVSFDGIEVCMVYSLSDVELVVNGDFENGNEGWPNAPVTDVTSIGGDGHAVGAVILNQTFKVEQNTWYLYSADTYRATPGRWCYLDMFPVAENMRLRGYKVGEWEHIAGLWYSGDNKTGSARVVTEANWDDPSASTDDGGNTYIDNVSLVKADVSENLITDPEFTSNGWQLNGNAQISGALGNGDSSSLRSTMTNSSAGAAVAIANNGSPIPVEKNTKYILSAWVHVEGSPRTVKACLDLNDIDGEVQIESTSYNQQTKGSHWVLMTGVWDSGSNTEATVRAFVEPTVEGAVSSAYIDSVSFRKAQPMQYGASLLNNGGFEDYFTDYSVTGWSIPASGLALSDDAVYGSRSIVLTGAGTRMTSSVSLEANTDYVLSGWMKCFESSSAEISLGSLAQLSSAKTGEWEYVSTVFNSGETTAAELELKAAEGTACFDALYIDKAANVFDTQGSVLSDDAVREELSSADTSLIVAVDNDKMYVEKLVSLDTGHEWITPAEAQEMPLVPKVNGVATDWKYTGKSVDTSDGKLLALTFTNADPAMELTAYWQAYPGDEGPVQYWAKIKNNSGGTLSFKYSDVISGDLTVTADSDASLTYFERQTYINTNLSDKVHTDALTSGYKNDSFILNEAAQLNNNFRLPYQLIETSTGQGLYFGYYYAFGKMSVETGSDARKIRISSTLGDSGVVTRKLEAGDRDGDGIADPDLDLTIPGMFFGTYKGSVDNGSNRMKDWFWNHRMTKTLRDNENEPLVELHLPFNSESEWTTYLNEHDVASWGVQLLKQDYWWTVPNSPPADGTFHPDLQSKWNPYPTKWPNGMILGDLAHSKGMQMTLYMCQTYQDTPLTDWTGRTKDLNALKYRLKEWHIDYYRSDFNLEGPDGTNNYAAHEGFMWILDQLIADPELPTFRYEHCSGGGTLKDFTTLERATFMTTEDSARAMAHRNVAYADTYMINPLQLKADLAIDWPPIEGSITDVEAYDYYVFRTALMGAVMVCPSTTLSGFSNHQIEVARESYRIYNTKQRAILRNCDVYHILPSPDGINWDGMEYMNKELGMGSILLFRPASHSEYTEKVIYPDGLDADKTYELTFEDNTELSVTKTGAELMEKGVLVRMDKDYDSEIIWIKELSDKEVAVRSITLYGDKEMKIGASQKIGYSVSPINATNTEMSWTSSEEEVAKVADGVVRAMYPGKAVITATAKDGSNVSESIEITVIDEISDEAYVCVNNTDPALSFGAGSRAGGGGSAYVNGDETLIGGYCEFTFTGTKIKYMSAKNIDCGISKVYIDGELAATVDHYATAHTVGAVFESDDLAPTEHTIKVVPSGKNPGAIGDLIPMDAFYYLPIFDIDSVTVLGEQSLTVGKTQKYTAKVLPRMAEQSVIWSVIPETGDGTISESGVFTPTKEGSVVIKAVSAADESKSGTLAVNISKTPVTSIEMDDVGEVLIGQQVQLSAKILPENATYKQIRWELINFTGTGSLDENGLFTALTAGMVIVKASSVDDPELYVLKLITITKPQPISISKLTVKLAKTLYTYDGTAKKPAVTVKDAEGNAIDAANYTVKYGTGRKVPGTYTVTVTMKGNYTGAKTLTFNIRGKQMAISKLTSLSKGFKATWAKQSYVTGYQFQYSTSSKFTTKTTKTVKITKNTTVSKSVTKLTAAKKYYVRIRSYKTTKISGKTYTVYSVWSKAKYVTTKK